MNTNAEQQHRPSILVVDDDVAITALVVDVLAGAGMDTTVFHEAEEALARCYTERFDLALLDVMMPGMDGYELCARMRQISDMPIVFLTAKGSESDLVLGLTLGADDYIVKPFRPRELVARIRARMRTGGAGQEGIIATRDFEIDTRSHVARLHGSELDLTPKEFAILSLLAERAGTPVSARELYEHAWGEPYDPSAANTVMVHIRHLRGKCANIDASQAFIDTVWGVGYRLGGAGGDAR